MLLNAHRHVIFPNKNYKRFCDNNSPAIFLDRDGVIIKEKHYLSRPDQVELETYAKEFISFFKKSGWLVIVVTNQSGISRGYFDWNQYESVTERMLSILDYECCPDAIYANSGLDHKSELWRKPEPGMILQAAQDFSLNDLSSSVLIGDKLTDLLAGYRAGVKNTILLKTGHGGKESANILQAFKEIKNIGNISTIKKTNEIADLKNTLKIYADLKVCFNNRHSFTNISK